MSSPPPHFDRTIRAGRVASCCCAALFLIVSIGCGWLREAPSGALWSATDGQAPAELDLPDDPLPASEDPSAEGDPATGTGVDLPGTDSAAAGTADTDSAPSPTSSEAPGNQVALASHEAMDSAAREILGRSTIRGSDGRQHCVWIRAIDADHTASSPNEPARQSGTRRRTPRQSGRIDSAEAPPDRWRYPDLEELIGRQPAGRPDFRSVLAGEDLAAGVNAAIALARLGDGAGIEWLFRGIQSPTLPLPMRCAAVEALGRLAAQSGTPPRVEAPGRVQAAVREAAAARLDELLRQYGGRQSPRGPYVPELHEELIRALARSGAGGDDPRFEQALRSDAKDVRLAAIAAYARPVDQSGAAATDLPQTLVDLRGAGNSEVRRAVLDVLITRRHPAALEALSAALRDNNLQVRLAAIAGLGRLGAADRQAEQGGAGQSRGERSAREHNAAGPSATERARSLLLEQLEQRASHIREAAVRALAQCGDKTAVLDRAEDESWRVRAAVAGSLGRWPQPDTARVAADLLDDPSSEVHRHLLEAVSSWPDELVGPVLLRAMAKRSLLCRKTAAEQLAARWSPAVEFPVEGPPARREEELERLGRQFKQEFGPLPTEAAAVSQVADMPVEVTVADLDRAEAYLATENYTALSKLGEKLPATLEQLVRQRGRLLPEAVFRDILPEHDPAFTLLVRLRDEDVLTRRRAAAHLADLAGEQPLPPLAVRRLAEVVIAEEDQLVWMEALDAVDGDTHEPARRLALAALSHPSPEVRRRGCEHFARTPSTDAVPGLLRSLDDRSDPVVAAAVAALGRLGRLDDRDRLVALLRRRNETLQLEVAGALSRLGDPRGAAALERLAYARDPEIRRGVAEKMGELADRQFVPTLVRLLEDRVSIMRTALASLPKVVGSDHSLRDDGTVPSTTDRIRAWQAWYRDRRSGD